MQHMAQESTADDVHSDRRELKVLDAKFTIGGLQDRLFELLSAIEAEGSLVAAAKKAGLSYKGAWDIIERASRHSPRALIDRNPGGGSDRGTRLTETGSALLGIHRKLEKHKLDLLRELNRDLAEDPILLQWYRGLILQSSARNQWRAEVLSVKSGVVRHEVTLRLEGGATLIASVSRKINSLMPLDFGRSVIALVKAPMVLLISEAECFEVSAENQFDGQVSDIFQDPISTEIIVRLPSGDHVVAAVSVDEMSELDVKVGDRVTVSFDADAVVIAALPLTKNKKEETHRWSRPG